MWQSVKVSNVFNTLTLKKIFWKTKTFFMKLEYCFLVEITKIENTSFSLKTALSEANAKMERWVQNASVTKNVGLPVTTFLREREFCFSFGTSYKALIWRNKDPDGHIRTFCKQWGFIWRCFFPVSILMKALIVKAFHLELTQLVTDFLNPSPHVRTYTHLEYSFFAYFTSRTFLLDF